MTPTPYLSRASLAKAIEISESTVDEMVRRGVLPPPVRLSSGCVRWRWESVERALASLEPQGNNQPADPYMEGARRAVQKATEGRRGTP